MNAHGDYEVAHSGRYEFPVVASVPSTVPAKSPGWNRSPIRSSLASRVESVSDITSGNVMFPNRAFAFGRNWYSASTEIPVRLSPKSVFAFSRSAQLRTCALERLDQSSLAEWLHHALHCVVSNDLCVKSLCEARTGRPRVGYTKPPTAGQLEGHVGGFAAWPRPPTDAW